VNSSRRESPSRSQHAAHGKTTSDLVFASRVCCRECRFFTVATFGSFSLAKSAEQCTPGQLVVYRIGIVIEEVIRKHSLRGAREFDRYRLCRSRCRSAFCGELASHSLRCGKVLIDETGARPPTTAPNAVSSATSGKSTRDVFGNNLTRTIPARSPTKRTSAHSDGNHFGRLRCRACVGRGVTDTFEARGLTPGAAAVSNHRTRFHGLRFRRL